MSEKPHTKIPKFGDPDFMPWVNKTLAKREIKKLHRKLKSLRRTLELCQERRNKHLEFELAFRKFVVRFEGRKYDSNYPIERIQEAIIHLKEKLP